MARRVMSWVMVALGMIAALALVVDGMLAADGSPEPNPVFWLIVGLFLLFIGWDIVLHVRIIRSRAPSDPDRPN